MAILTDGVESMRTHEFSVILSGVSEVTEEAADALFEAGCDDGTFVSRDGVAYVAFSREADSLEAAIKSAIRDVRKAGYEVSRIEFEPAAFESI
jgi:hypothetical protein